MRRDYKDITVGLLLAAMGVFVAVYARMNYPFGTIRRMGPGMFPAGLGVVLAGFGLMIAVPALFRAGSFPKVNLRPGIAVLCGVALFALTVDRFGLIPAVMLLVGAACLGDDRLKPWVMLVLGGGLGIAAYLIFHVGLQMPFHAFAWPS